jgi:hypothetical protein
LKRREVGDVGAFDGLTDEQLVFAGLLLVNKKPH